MKVVNQTTPPPEVVQDFFTAKEDGPFIMLNLLKFKEKAEYEDGSDADISGAEAYARYGAVATQCIMEVGGKPRTAGAITGLLLGEVEEMWDMVALVEYPSLEAFRNMLSSEKYQAAVFHREAGLAGQLNLKVKTGGQ